MSTTKTQRMHLSYAEQAHDRIEEDFAGLIVPEDWHEIWRDRDHRSERRVKATLMLDADVVRFFKAMGQGYQPRINRVLRAFMHDRLAGVVTGPEDRATGRDVAEIERLIAAVDALGGQRTGTE